MKINKDATEATPRTNALASTHFPNNYGAAITIARQLERDLATEKRAADLIARERDAFQVALAAERAKVPADKALLRECREFAQSVLNGDGPDIEHNIQLLDCIDAALAQAEAPAESGARILSAECERDQ